MGDGGVSRDSTAPCPPPPISMCASLPSFLSFYLLSLSVLLVGLKLSLRVTDKQNSVENCRSALFSVQCERGPQLTAPTPAPSWLRSCGWAARGTCRELCSGPGEAQVGAWCPVRLSGRSQSLAGRFAHTLCCS